MKRRFSLFFLVILLAAVSCSPASEVVPPTSTTASGSLPTPRLKITEAPDAQTAVESFLSYWQAEDYESMYAMLSQVSRDAIPFEQFVARYKDAAASLTLQELNSQVLSTLTNPTSAQVAYRAIFDTSMFDQIQRDMIMNLVLEDNNWRILWEDGLILPELSGGNRLALDIKSPSRGSIKDINGSNLASQADAVAIGIIPSQVPNGQAGFLLSQAASLTGIDLRTVNDIYERDFNEWYIAIGEALLQSVQDLQGRYPSLINNAGLQFREYSSRFYPEGGIAPNAVGYTLSIPAERLEEYQRLGYPTNGKIGASGLEKWGEEYLAGRRGSSLYVVDPKGQVVTRLAQVESKPSNNIYTTLDADLQAEVQRSIDGFKGSAVVLERDTGRILAMASSPSFDQNLLDPGNYNSIYRQGEIFNSPDLPLLNRATQSSYPVGSVFKIITMAAALESGLFSKDTVYNCGHEFTDLAGLTLYDWTYAKEVSPSGDLNLMEGLMRSCNPWFWHIGLELFRQGKTKDLAEMARAFGLGSPTGIDQVPEDGGSIQDVTSEGDAVQLAIGQGTMLATPLQIANMVAAVGNGGTLYKPQLVERIEGLDGTDVFTFKPEVIRQLPISPENLEAIQTAMNMVVNNTRGTAYRSFLGMNYKIHAKTGSATTSAEDPHSWFAGYTDERREDLPDIAVAVVAENAGEGSEIAAKIFRRILEVYYEGQPRTLYPWESSFYITRTPTPLPTDTFTPGPPPTEEPTETPQP